MTEEFNIALITKLLSAFLDAPTNVYRVAQMPGWNYPTAHRYAQYCLNNGLLEFDHEENNKGLVAKFYRLTEKGLQQLSLHKEIPMPEKLPRKEEKPAQKKPTGIYLRT